MSRLTEAVVEAADEPMPYRWRVTNTEDGTLGIDVGDQFVENKAFAGDMMGQIGVSMLNNAMQLLGISDASRQMISLMVLKLSAGGDSDD